jgi:hypothetical protein
MAKIKLALEDLSVESFHVTPAGERRGTVIGHDSDATCANSNCAQTCTDMTDCWGECYPASGSLGCAGAETNANEYTCHVGTCPGLATCDGYAQGKDSCWSCDPYAGTCEVYCPA